MTSGGRNVPAHDSIGLRRGARPLPSPGLTVTPYPKPSEQWFQSPLPSQPSRFPPCSGGEWTIYIQRASAVFSSSRGTHQVAHFYVPRPGNRFPSTQYVYQRQSCSSQDRVRAGWCGRRNAAGECVVCGTEVLKLLI